MGGGPTPKWDPIGFDSQRFMLGTIIKQLFGGGGAGSSTSAFLPSFRVILVVDLSIGELVMFCEGSWRLQVRVDSNHSFQPSFFSKTSCFSKVSGGFPERRIPGKNGESTPRVINFGVINLEGGGAPLLVANTPYA